VIKPNSDFYYLYDGEIRRQPCRECILTRKRERYAASEGRGADVSYEQLLKRDYGITLAQYNDMLRKQANRCAICRRPESVKYASGRVKRMAVDHDHVTNAVRALLCQRCNTVVWALEDNHVTLGAVSAYIEEWRNSFANGVPL
jgi:uncharacterized protein with PIN domain